MKPSRSVNKAAVLIVSLVCLGALAYRQRHVFYGRSFVPSAKAKAKLQTLRDQLTARINQMQSKGQPNKPLGLASLPNANSAGGANLVAGAPTYKVDATPALEHEVDELDGIEIPLGEDERAKEVWAAAAAAQAAAHQRLERIKKLYPFTTPYLFTNKEERIKQELRQTHPEIGAAKSWREILNKLPRFQWSGYQSYVNIHDQGKCNQCWVFAAVAAYETNQRLLQKLGGVYLDPSVEPEALESAPLPSGFSLLSPWTMQRDKDEICREVINSAGAKEPQCRPVIYSLTAPPPYMANDDSVRKFAAQIITNRDACATTGWHGTAFNQMLKTARQNADYRGLVSWDYLNYPPSQIPTVEQFKLALLERGPLVVLMHMDKFFQAYKSGVFNEQSQEEVNHAVLLTGWDDDKKAWRIQNSFGYEWGEEGYMWIAWGSNSIGKYAAWVEVQ